MAQQCWVVTPSRTTIVMTFAIRKGPKTFRNTSVFNFENFHNISGKKEERVALALMRQNFVMELIKANNKMNLE